MPSGAVVSLGTTLSIDIAGGTSWTVIAEVHEISGPGISRTIMDISNLSSGQFREKLGGLVNLGEITLGIRLIPNATANSHFTLLQELSVGGSARTLAAINATRAAFKILWELGTTDCSWSFKGFVSNFQPSMSVDSPVEADVTIEVDGIGTNGIALATT